MAEVIGIASGITSLLSMTIEVIGISYKYIVAVKDAPTSVQRLVNELEEFKIVLLRIDQMAKETDQKEIFGEGGSCMLSVSEGNDCLSLLETIRAKLEKRDSNGSFSKKLKALTWPFSEEKTRALIETLHRHLERFSTVLAIDSLGTEALLEKDNVAVLDWLSPLNMYQRQQDTLARRHGSTGTWLLSTDIFKDWVNNKGTRRTLWCPGDPGTGKTVMTSIVIDYLTTLYSSSDARIAYVYCDYKDQATHTSSNLIACLARQLIGRPEKLPQQLLKLHEKLEFQKRRPDSDELEHLLVSLCNERELTYILVDALDECEATIQRRRFLPLLQSLPQGAARLFVTSRPNNEDIYDAFSTVSQIVISAPVIDIKRFVTERMDEKRDFAKRLSPELKDQITSTISSRASGMFLLAVLQIDRICVARTVKQIKNALNSMPKELDELYEDTLARIQKQPGEDGELGMRIIAWITHARRPLTVDELCHGLAVECDCVEEDSKTLDPDNILPFESLTDVCAGLIVIDPQSQIVRLVHYTVQEFFDRQRLKYFAHIEEEIARACLTHLSHDICIQSVRTKSHIGDTLLEWPFLAYASVHWLYHVKESGEQSQDSLLSDAVNYVNATETLQFCAFVWATTLLKTPIQSKRQILLNSSGKTILGDSPLEVASECGLHDYVLFLLNHTQWSISMVDCSLYYAAERGHTSIVKIMITHGGSVSRLAPEGCNAFHQACKGGHKDVAEVLAQNDQLLFMTSDRWKWSPLHHAVYNGHPDLVEYLVRNGADLKAQTPLGLTACHLAARRGDISSVLYCLSGNPDTIISLQTRAGRTPLHSAAEGGHLKVIRMLLSNGADVSAVDQDGYTPRALLKDRNSAEVEEVFHAYMQADLSTKASSATQPQDDQTASQVTPSQEEKIPDLPVLFEDYFKPHHSELDQSPTTPGPSADASSSERTRSFGRKISPNRDREMKEIPVPSLRLVMPTPPDSPTNSSGNELLYRSEYYSEYY
ncbi:hypothetical protein ACLMJK_008257 [Lecanora helva]